jgi:hypothetical protein
VWVRRLWAEQPGLYRGYIVDVVTAVVVGLALVLGGRQRTVAVAWRTLNESGGPVLWGSVFLACAILLIAATFFSRRVLWLTLWVAAVPYALIGSGFLFGALTEPTASFLGALLCFRTAFMHLSRAEAYRAGSSVPA